MAIVLKAGTLTNYEGSMAEAMEIAFIDQWPKAMEDMPFPGASPEMKLLFVAIAQGVVRHLVEREGAFRVVVEPHPEHRHNLPSGGATNDVGEFEHSASVGINHVKTIAEETI